MHNLGENISKEKRHSKIIRHYYRYMDNKKENRMKSKFVIYFLKEILKILLVDLKVKIENCS